MNPSQRKNQVAVTPPKGTKGQLMTPAIRVVPLTMEGLRNHLKKAQTALNKILVGPGTDQQVTRIWTDLELRAQSMTKDLARLQTLEFPSHQAADQTATETAKILVKLGNEVASLEKLVEAQANPPKKKKLTLPQKQNLILEAMQKIHQEKVLEPNLKNKLILPGPEAMAARLTKVIKETTYPIPPRPDQLNLWRILDESLQMELIKPEARREVHLLLNLSQDLSLWDLATLDRQLTMMDQAKRLRTWPLLMRQTSHRIQRRVSAEIVEQELLSQNQRIFLTTVPLMMLLS
jgi:hypothetical protein